MGEIHIRIKEVMDALDTNVNAFSKQHGLKRATLYNLLGESRKPNFDTLVSVCTAEPRISAEYLIRGEGKPLRDPDAIDPVAYAAEQLRIMQAELNQQFEHRLSRLRNA